jgi:hypothetical protein
MDVDDKTSLEFVGFFFSEEVRKMLAPPYCINHDLSPPARKKRIKFQSYMFFLKNNSFLFPKPLTFDFFQLSTRLI